MTRRNPPGAGNVEELPSGRWRVRMRIAGKTGRSLPGTYETFEEADAVRVASIAHLAATGQASVGALTLRAYGLVVLDRRKLHGHRNDRDDRRRFEFHIATAHFAEWPIETIRRVDVKRWRDEMIRKTAVRALRRKVEGVWTVTHATTTRPLAKQTLLNTLNLLRAIFAEACEDEIVEQNPALGVRIRGVARTKEPWTYLIPAEQEALLNAVPVADHALVAFAMGTGLREDELYALRLEDVVLDGPRPHVVVRFGSRHAAPKNSQIRRVPLFGLGFAGALEQIRNLLRLRNRLGLFFPGKRGGFRPEGKAPKGWTAWLVAAGVERRVRFHDLRHTCGASLVSGFWGRPWTLEEVQAMLGHISRQSTERYAHMAQSALSRAALETHHTWPMLGVGKE